ncbi:MAG: solute carrier family 23 protein, partial [Rhodospirillales bacterium]
APLAQSIPGYATAPALLYVACLMAGSIADVEWEDVTEAAPAVVTAIAMPLTFSIAHGIAIGFTLYGIIKIASGKYSEASPAVLVLAGLFILKFIFLP